MAGKRISDQQFAITLGTMLRTLQYFKQINPSAEGNFSPEDLCKKARAELVQERLQAIYNDLAGSASHSNCAMTFREIHIPIELFDEVQAIFQILAPPKKIRGRKK